MKVVPGVGIGPFELGSSISSVLGILQDDYVDDERDILYSETRPWDVDIIITVASLGMRFRFEPQSQRLHTIDVFNPSAVGLVYRGVRFSGPDRPSTFLGLYELFGPTYPGDLMEDWYFLHYRGLTFTFRIPGRYKHLYGKDSHDMPLEFPDGTTPVAARLIIYHGSDVFSPKLPPAPVDDRCIRPWAARGDPVTLTVVKKACKGYSSYSEAALEVEKGTLVCLGDTLQHVLSALGPPSAIFEKTPAKMSIHRDSGSKLSKTSTRQPDCYFLNYFDAGLDVLMRATKGKHVAHKIVLHTNAPGHAAFNRYAKCQFKLVVKNAEKRADKRSVGDGGLESKGEEAASLSVVNPEDPWTEVTKVLGPGGRPMVHAHHTASGASNPFGPTHFYAYCGLVFEVMRNGIIASVTCFQAD